MIDFDFIEWDDPDRPRGNTAYIGEHGVTIEEVEEILYDPDAIDAVSRSSGRPARIGWTRTGRRLFVVYEIDREGGVVVIRPTNAYELEIEQETGW